MKSAEQWYDEGDALFQQGEFNEGNQCFNEALILDNKFMPAYRGKYRCLLAMGKYQETIKWCDKALEIDPTYRFALNSKANALNTLRRHHEALEYFDKAITLYPDWEFPYNGKANSLSCLRREEEALIYYKKSLVLVPNDTCVLRNISICLTDLDRKQEAKEYLDKLIEINPESAQALCDRGLLLQSLGDKPKALEDFKRAQSLMKNGFLDVNLEPRHLIFIKSTLESIPELHKLESEHVTQYLIKKFVRKLKRRIRIKKEQKDSGLQNQLRSEEYKVNGEEEIKRVSEEQILLDDPTNQIEVNVSHNKETKVTESTKKTKSSQNLDRPGEI